MSGAGKRRNGKKKDLKKGIALLFICALFSGALALFGDEPGQKPESNETGSAAVSEDAVSEDFEETTEKGAEEKNTPEEAAPEEAATEEAATEKAATEEMVDIASVPPYEGNAYVKINGNIPYFTEAEKQNIEPFEEYSDLDSLGRCGVAFANICTEIQPTEERGEIGQIKPSGWHTVKYNGIIDGNYLYNRCHLIGYQLSGENANEKNLITGTRYLNMVGMLPFENMVADYVDTYHNHVLYRVTPVFEGDNLIADGVLLEGWSVEDSGKGICFNVYCYNVQPGIEINYSNGESRPNDDVIICDDGTYKFDVQQPD